MEIAIPALVITLLFIAWYASRPERLITKRGVSEAFPATNVGSQGPVLDSRTFHSVLYPAEESNGLSSLACRVVDRQREVKCCTWP